MPSLLPRNNTVRDQLEVLTTGTAALAADGPNATTSLSAPELARRQVGFIEQYLALETDISLDGAAAVVTAGPPGAGKSHAIEASNLLPPQARNIDSDEIKKLILRDGLGSGVWSSLLAQTLADHQPVRPLELASLVHRESLAIYDAVLRISLDRGENVVIHGTLGWNRQPALLLDQLSMAAYESLTIVDVEVTAQQAVEQAYDRWWAGRIDASDDLGGRFVPRAVIARLYTSGPASVCAQHAMTMYDLSELIDTTLIRTASAGTGIPAISQSKHAPSS